MSQSRFPSILLFGAPGVGKGTQGRILGQIPGFSHLSSGDVFRSLDNSSPEGRKVSGYTSRGELVPDDLTIRIWSNALDEHLRAGRYLPKRDLLLLDGIPRNVPQAELIAKRVDVWHVVCLVSSDEEVMLQRIKSRALEENRADDADENVIRRRFEVYRRESEPVLRQYPKDSISRVDALGTPAEVLRSVLDRLIPVQNKFLDRK